MMPVQSRRQGDDLFVDNVDLKRAARNLLNKTRAPGWTPPSDLNQAMELMASCFGYANLLAANTQAVKAPQAAERAAPVVLAEGLMDKIRLQAAGVPNVMLPGEAARLPEPRVVVYEADDRFDDDALARALERAGDVGVGKRFMELDMSDYKSITTLRQFRKLEKPDVVVCTNVELGANSVSTSELMHVMVNNPGIEFRLVMRTTAEAHKLFATWVYQDNSPAISGFLGDSGRGDRTAHVTKAYDPSDTKNGRALVAYPHAFHELLRASRSNAAASPAISAAEQALVDRMMTSRRDGRQMMRIGMGLEDLVARADALAAAGPDAARAALENATTHFILTPGSAMGKAAAFHAAPDTFPTDCGPRFDQRWKNLASVGFLECLSGAVASGDIVAVIGRTGSGKSLLVNAMAKSMGGAIIDFRLKTWQEDFDRVRRAPPSLVFIEELYHHSEATEMEVAAFALAAKSTKTVFVFQRYDTLMQSMLSRRYPSGKPLFTLARVLDLDRMTLNTVYAEQPMVFDQLHPARPDETPHYTPGYTPSASGNRVWVRLNVECIGGSFEAELLPHDMIIRSGDHLPGGTVLSVRLSIMKDSPSGERSVEAASKTFQAREWARFVESVDPVVFHRECTESGYVDIARAMEVAQRKLDVDSGFRTKDVNDAVSGDQAPTPSPHRRKNRQ